MASGRNVHTSRSAQGVQPFTVLPGHLVSLAVDPRASLGSLARDRIAVYHARQMRPHRVAALVNAVQRDVHGNAEWIEVMLVGTMLHVQSAEPLLVLEEHDLVVFPLQRHILRVHAIHGTTAPPAPLRRKLATARYLAWAQTLAPATISLNSSTSVNELQVISPAKLAEACARAHQQAMDMELVDRRAAWDDADCGAEPRMHVWFDAETSSLADPMKLLDDLEELYVIELVKHERDQQAALSSPPDSPVRPEFITKHTPRSNPSQRSSSSPPRQGRGIPLVPRRFVRLVKQRCSFWFGSTTPRQADPRLELQTGPFNSDASRESSEQLGSTTRPHLARHFTPTRLEPIVDSDEDQESFESARPQEPGQATVISDSIRRGGRLAARKLIWWLK